MTMDNSDKIKNQKPARSAGGSKIKNTDEDKQLDWKNIEKELKKKVEECEGRYKRALADYQNLEKRVAEERRELILKSNKELLLRLLPVLDTLMVAANHVKDEGLTLSIKQFLDTLKLEGVGKIEVLGKSFDPHLMECIDTAEGDTDKVLEEFRAGYTLHGQVIRTAQVKVGKKRKENEEEEKAKEQLQKGDYM